MLSSGTRLGPYEIVAPIGAGGMGEVFRARDTRLERSVAIKILPTEFAHDAQLKARLEREAKTISQLNHPHICALFDVGHDSGTDYLVMEYIEGESLADRLMRGALPLDLVLRYSIEMADALDKAHRKGIVHRDLKPGNVMLTKSGTKLLDFGLAKTNPKEGEGSALTVQKPLTSEGTIVGTFQYMAPEQLEGQEVDARTDIFALGAVMYEMASGKRAFDGKSKSSVIAAILGADPKPIRELQPLTPPALERAIRNALNKDPDDRWQCAADLRWELLRIQEDLGIEKATPARGSRTAWSVAALAFLAAVILGAIALRRDASAPVIRLSVALPPGWTFSMNYGLGPPALSPDGRYLAFAATDAPTGRLLLWIRDIAATEPTAVPGTEGAGFAFWSPDSKSIAFFAGGYLKRIDVVGGAAQVLCPATYGRGGSWSQGNEIIFSPSGDGPLYRVSGDGGTPQQLTTLDASQSEASHRWPYFLPDGKHFLYLARRPWTGEEVGDSIYVASVDDPARRLLLNASSQVVYAEPGYLLYLRDRTLVAQRFNPRTLRLDGEPRVVVREPLAYHPAGFGLFTCSRNGVLAYGTGGIPSTIAWIDRNGQMETIVGGSDFTTPRFSADGQQFVYARPDPATGNQDIWLYDVARRVSRRITFHPRDDMDGLLTPDGRNLISSSNRSGFPNLYMKSIDGTKDELLFGGTRALFASSISPDGRALLFRQLSAQTTNDVYVFDFQSRKVIPFAATSYSEIQPVFSPTGRWIAYASNESGRYEVYASRYPDNSSRVQISTSGGTQPAWRGDEKELFYLTSGDQIMSVPIDTSKGVLKPGTAVNVVEVPLRPSRNEEREYDVSRDGRRFLVNAVPPDKRSQPITVVVNWLSDFEQK